MLAQVLLYDGFDELDAFGPYETLVNAGRAGADLVCELVTLDAPGTVTGSHGVTVTTAAALAPAPDVLVVPGGGWAARNDAGTWGEYHRGTLPAAIAERHRAGAVVAAVCTGGMLLGAAGLVRGRPAITHQVAVEDLAADGARIVQARVVDDGDLVTAGGVTSGIDLALWLVEREFGAALAEQVATGLEYERRGAVHRG